MQIYFLFGYLSPGPLPKCRDEVQESLQFGRPLNHNSGTSANNAGRELDDAGLSQQPFFHYRKVGSDIELSNS